jgi:hypothetical protein
VLDFAGDDPGRLQDPQWFGHRGLGEFHLIDHVAAEAALLLEQHAHDLNACRMTERLGNRGDLVTGPFAGGDVGDGEPRLGDRGHGSISHRLSSIDDV